MTIVTDNHIPFLVETVRKEWPQVEIFPMESEEIDNSAVRNADVLVVRTRTLVNEQLLRNTSIRLVCTATIGFDHIDTAYCDAHNIRWMSCPGCNAQAVCDYIEEALDEYQMSKTKLIAPLRQRNVKCQISNTPTIGIVGVGHVGSLVAKMAERRGLNVLLNDPPKGIGESLDFIAQNSDIITFHVPLDKTTYHMCDEAFLKRCKPNALIINAARGGIVDEKALLRSGHPYILDTWENEPHINPDVLDHALLASMHIAGYSVEGKRNATQMCLDCIAEQFALPKIKITGSRNHVITTKKDSNEPWLAAITRDLKAHPTAFEQLRKAYPLRGE